MKAKNGKFGVWCNVMGEAPLFFGDPVALVQKVAVV